ncbi:ROK family protein, partial [Pseudomonas aeruginosa]|nr:ROK family protein [Pseudomonas aeruginosa]
ISSAGVVDEQKGEIGYAGPTIPNYKGTNFKRLLKSLSPYVKVKNDVNAALLGELKLHQYQAERIFCMTLGTGIGRACTRLIFFISLMRSFIRQLKLATYFIV